MELKLHFASLSLGAAVDQQTGNLSVFDMVEEIRVPQLPIQLQALVISLALVKEGAGEFTGKMLIHVFLPDGKQQSLGTGDLRLPPEQKRMKAVFRFGGFPIPLFGPYRFVVSWVNSSGAKIGEALLDFDVIQATQVAQGMSPKDKPQLTH